MTPEQFCFWLHGFFELAGSTALTPAQSKMICEHLDLVFTKVTLPLSVPPAEPAKFDAEKAVKELRKSMNRAQARTGRMC